MKNITLSAEEDLIEAARTRARLEHTTLNQQFRNWLQEYARRRERLDDYDQLMAEMSGKIRIGGKLSRDELNER